MEAEIVRAALHVGCAHGTAERARQCGHVLVEDLILKRSRPGRDEDAAAGERRGNEVGERLAGSRAGFCDQRPADVERIRDRARERALALARLELVERRGQRPFRVEDVVDASN
jgi:hypothetical protein